MTSIVITEKPSQARNIRAAVGGKYGEILAAQGHLLRLQEPEDINPDWKSWDAVLLRPQSGFYGLAPDRAQGKGERIDRIRAALQTAERVYIATDCDREGQAIGENLLRHFRYKGLVLRAMFTAEDEKTLRDAFANARPNTDYLPLYQAAVARAQSDQIYNLSLTRAATTRLVPSGVRQVIGIGRVRTPTLGIVCRREHELATFRSQDYHELTATVDGGNGSFILAHRPKAEKRYFDRALAEAVREAAIGYSGPITVKQEEKRQSPGKPADLPTLQKRAATWGWTAQKTLQTAQSLYETHKVTTYPRAATRYLPENMIDGAKEVFAALGKVDTTWGLWPDATIRTGKKGVFSNAGLDGESHHAIIPNPAMADQLPELVQKLNEDERRLFDFIAKSFLAALGPDHVYLRTEIALTIAHLPEPVVFNAIGKQTKEAGWKAIHGNSRDDDEEEGEAEQELPAIKDGATVSIVSADIETKKTTPPPRYSEGSLIEAMQNAWKFVEDAEEQARLKEAKGIGTPATRDTIIEGLKRQNFMEVKKGKLHATQAAMDLYRILSERCADVLDPASTARMENRLDDILRGSANARAVVDEICNAAQTVINALSGSGEQLAIKRKPSPAMLKFAKIKAEKEGVKLTKAQLEDFDALREFLGPMEERPEAAKPCPNGAGKADCAAHRRGHPP
ncbi:DNA topoisomerase III [Roseibium sp. TrichSKD4]|uniref:DNA topoisomerase n=1 Tax=Roseibium sp. TrichSKD4 TaxID=744980 RepID=UPI0001E57217|nr:DNA topoisomerase [Roseibium sp. TrichSKD4]EFO28773.1 DNA topoisomerase III [Roseibium sp. TrichSKD4]